MAYTLQPWRVFLAALAGWINRHQQAAIEFVREENRALLEQLGDRRIRLTDEQRRRTVWTTRSPLESRRRETRIGFLARDRLMQELPY